MTCELNVCASTVRDWTIEFIDERLNLFNFTFQLRADEKMTDVNKCTSYDWTSSTTVGGDKQIIIRYLMLSALYETVSGTPFSDQTVPILTITPTATHPQLASYKR